MIFKKGDTYRAKINIEKPYKIHIVAIVDDEMVVYKYYGRHKQWWHYEIERDIFVEAKIAWANKPGQTNLGKQAWESMRLKRDSVNASSSPLRYP